MEAATIVVEKTLVLATAQATVANHHRNKRIFPRDLRKF